MTLEEAKQLKPGDKIFVEMIVDKSLTSKGKIYAGIKDTESGGVKNNICIPTDIICASNNEPFEFSENRKFQKEDIVQTKLNGALVFGRVNADEHPIVEFDDGAIIHYVRPYKVKLVCPVEGRHDAKGGEA